MRLSEFTNLTIVDIDELKKDTQYDILSSLCDHIDYFNGQTAEDIWYDFIGLVEQVPVEIGMSNLKDILKTYNRTPSDIAVKKYTTMLSNPNFNFDPIIINNGVFVDGGHRVEAYRRAGRTHIPVVDVRILFRQSSEFYEQWIDGDEVIWK